MDEFTTPQPRRSRSLSNHEFLSKNGLIDLLRVIDFHGLYLPANVTSDNTDDTPSFLKAICDGLVTVLLTHAPKQASPKKLLNSSSPFISSTTDSSAGDSGSPRIKLYSAKGRPPSLIPSSPPLAALTTSVISLYSGNTPDPSFPPFPEDVDAKMYEHMASRKGLFSSDPYSIRLALVSDTVWPFVNVRVNMKLPSTGDDG